jgi:hypothetical protein
MAVVCPLPARAVEGVSVKATQIISRIGAALLGGYAFVWGFVTLSITSLSYTGMDYHDAWMLAMMLAFLLFLGAVLWSFTTRSSLRAWLVLGGSGALMTTCALLLSRQLMAGG